MQRSVPINQNANTPLPTNAMEWEGLQIRAFVKERARKPEETGGSTASRGLTSLASWLFLSNADSDDPAVD